MDGTLLSPFSTLNGNIGVRNLKLFLLLPLSFFHNEINILFVIWFVLFQLLNVLFLFHIFYILLSTISLIIFVVGQIVHVVDKSSFTLELTDNKVCSIRLEFADLLQIFGWTNYLAFFLFLCDLVDEFLTLVLDDDRFLVQQPNNSCLLLYAHFKLIKTFSKLVKFQRDVFAYNLNCWDGWSILFQEIVLNDS